MIARALAEEGADVAVCARTAGAVDATVLGSLDLLGANAGAQGRPGLRGF